MPPSICVPARLTHGSPGTKFARWLLVWLASAAWIAAPASAQRVRIGALSDVSFGTVSSLQSDQRQSRSICIYSNGQTSGYSVSASGSGSAGTFELLNGPNTLRYDVEWSPVSGQTTGTSLRPNVPLTGQFSAASHQTCSNGPTTSASLIVVLRGFDLAQAREGTYTGSLSLLISAE